MAQPSDHTNGEEFSGDEGLPTREETSQFQFECPDGRSVSKNQNRQTQLLWGACGQQRLCSDRLLIVALFIIVIVWVQLVGFIVLFNVSPAKVRNTKLYSALISQLYLYLKDYIVTDM